MSRHKTRAAQVGFSLIEILIAILVVGFGLIGLAKIQAVSVGESTTADLRALMAFQADALASAMHGNLAYWTSSTVTTSASYLNGKVTDTTLGASVGSCAGTGGGSSTCSAAQLAASDVQTFAANVAALSPTTSGTISCSQMQPAGSGSLAGATTGTYPLMYCTVSMYWAEKASVAVNQAVATITTGSQVTTQSYKFVVQP